MGAKNVKKVKGKGVFVTKRRVVGHHMEGNKRVPEFEHITVQLTKKQLKAEVMRVNKWDEITYKHEYDKFRNKLRAYENYKEASGEKVTRQSPLEVLYYKAKAKKKYGPEYKGSIEMREIESFSSVSSGKAGKKALTGKRYRSKRDIHFTEKTRQAFGGLLAQSEQARKIFDEIKNPVQREKALAKYAEALHAKLDEDGKVKPGQTPIAYGHAVGSPDGIKDEDVDNIIKDYMD